MKGNKPLGPDKHKNRSKELKIEGELSPVRVKESHFLLDYWATRIAEARATMAWALNVDHSEQREALVSPSFINDPLLLLEYWVARHGEARARMEERFALASLHLNMEIALKESNDMLRRLEAAAENAPDAKDSLMNGPLF